MGINHNKVSAIADLSDTSVVRPSDWNAAHSIVGDLFISGNNQSIVLGGSSSGNVKFYYDGTDGKIDTNLSSASDLKLNCGSGKTLSFTTPIWNDINFEGVQLGVGASVPDLITLFTSSNIKGRGFDGNNTLEQLYGGSEITHDYKEGTDIKFHVHWMPTTTASGVVKWNLEYNWVNVSGVYPVPTNISITNQASGQSWQHQKVRFDDISGSGKLIGSQFIFRFFRDPADSQDTYPDDAALLSLGIHYQIDTVGSRLETEK